MHIMNRLGICFLLLMVLFMGCKNVSPNADNPDEDPKAKELLQGIWVSDDGGTPAIWAKGDSIYYPDSASMPVRFWIYKDSLYLKGNNINSYKITKQAEHLFKFVNKNGEEVKLVKSNNRDLLPSFMYQVYAMNTFLTAQSDTIVKTTMGFFESKVNIATTSDRVVKSSYNDNGVEVDNTYLDNVAHLAISNHGSLVYAHDFRKQEFAALIDKTLMAKSILRKFEFTHCDDKALYYDAVIGVPDASTAYVVEVRITTDGKVTQRMR